MIRKAIIRRRVKKAVRMWVKETSDAFERQSMPSRKMSMEQAPGYVPCTYWPGMWVEGDDLFRERIKGEQHAKR